jgi:type I restriction enzyme S subunit
MTTSPKVESNGRLKPYPSYKDSGVKWFGLIPTQWQVMPLKRVLRVQSGDFLPPEAEVEAGYPIYGGNGIRGYANKFNCSGPMILIGRVGAKCGCVHLVDGDFSASEHALRAFIQKPVELRYLAFLLRVLDLNRLAIRTAQPLINTEIVETAFSAIPPIDDQQAIADSLTGKPGRLMRW